jgi:peptidyl-prolyl cis-trans isomerase C
MRRQVLRAAVVAAALFLAAPRSDAEPAAALRDTDVAARVNGTPIYRKSVREVVQGVLTVQDSEPDPAAIGKLADDALDSLIALELLFQESQVRGVTVSDAAVDEEIARSRRGFPNAQAFDKALRVKGMTEADLRRDTQKTMAVNRLLEGIVWKDVRVAPEQIKDFYERNREEFKHPAQIRASHILISLPENASAADRDTAQKRAAALLAALQGGADFAQLARENSQDPGSASRGGDLGYFAKGDMVEAFEAQAFALAPGQLSAVVTTPYGLHIIKATDRRGAGYESLDDVRERITAVLIKLERERRQAELIAELRKKAKIELPETARGEETHGP